MIILKESPVFMYSLIALVIGPSFMLVILTIPLSYILSNQLDPVVSERFPACGFRYLNGFPFAAVKVVLYALGVVWPGYVKRHFQRYPLKDHVGRATYALCVIFILLILAAGVGVVMGMLLLLQENFR